jgi:hypothetical protein
MTRHCGGHPDGGWRPVIPGRDRCGGDLPRGKRLNKEVLSMRLGKEQAVGYVEDTDYVNDSVTDSLPAEELTVGRSEGMPLTTAPESPLTVS